MKASEIIKLLQKEIDKEGDKEVMFWGYYGARETIFEIMSNQTFENEFIENEEYINVWTNLSTG